MAITRLWLSLAACVFSVHAEKISHPTQRRVTCAQFTAGETRDSCNEHEASLTNLLRGAINQMHPAYYPWAVTEAEADKLDVPWHSAANTSVGMTARTKLFETTDAVYSSGPFVLPVGVTRLTRNPTPSSSPSCSQKISEAAPGWGCGAGLFPTIGAWTVPRVDPLSDPYSGDSATWNFGYQLFESKQQGKCSTQSGHVVTSTQAGPVTCQAPKTKAECSAWSQMVRYAHDAAALLTD